MPINLFSYNIIRNTYIYIVKVTLPQQGCDQQTNAYKFHENNPQSETDERKKTEMKNK